MSAQSVGIIGVGLLGSALAERFLSAGHRVIGYDLRPDWHKQFSSHDVSAVQDVTEIPASSQRIVLSLPDTDIVQQVIEHLRDALRPNTIIIDTTTGHPDVMQRLGEELSLSHVQYVDATVAGSSQQVRLGKAVVMFGGTDQAYGACEDLFRTFAINAFHVGPCGSGARMKLVVNLALGLNRAVLAESLAFADKSGVDTRQALEILSAGPAFSRVMDHKGKKMLDKDFQPQARLAQHLKDVRLILEMAKDSDTRLPLSTLHEQLLAELVERGYGDLDNSAIVKAYD